MPLDCEKEENRIHEKYLRQIRQLAKKNNMEYKNEHYDVGDSTANFYLKTGLFSSEKILYWYPFHRFVTEVYLKNKDYQQLALELEELFKQRNNELKLLGGKKL